MTRREEYRYLATRLRDRALNEKNPIVRARWRRLAESYVCLAEQSEEVEFEKQPQENDQASRFHDPIMDILVSASACTALRS